MKPADRGRTSSDTVVDLLWFSIAALLGFVIFVGTPYLFGVALPEPPAFFAVVTRAVEKQMYITAIPLGCVGALIGWKSSRLWALQCMATMSLLPVVAMVEIQFHSTSHNLLPFEFVLYGFNTAPALIGGLVARRVSGVASRNSQDDLQ